MPGVRVNFGKRGASLSVGGKGGRLTFGSSGTRASIGIPGTGLSFSERVDAGYWRKKQEREQRRIERETERREQAQRRLEAAQFRAEALSNCKVSLNEDGSIRVVNAFGEPLSGSGLRLAWEQQGTVIHRWLEEQATIINAEADRLIRIHEDTPDPENEPAYERLPFEEPSPLRNEIAAFQSPEPQPPCLQKPGVMHRLLPWLARALERKNAARQREYEERLEQWRQQLKEHEANANRAETEWREALAVWESRRSAHEEEQERLEAEWRQAIVTGLGAMESVLTQALEMVEWPLETQVDFSIENGGTTVWLDVDLPEIEDIPARAASVAASGRRLNIRQKPKSQVQAEYARHIHGIGFRLAGIVFASLPICRMAIISGYSQRLDGATGRVLDDYLYSVPINRDRFSEIDFSALDRVDPVEALARFDIRRKMTKSFTFKAIEPMGREEVPEAASV